MKHHENEMPALDPVGMSWKLFLYTIAGVIAYGLLVFIMMR